MKLEAFRTELKRALKGRELIVSSDLRGQLTVRAIGDFTRSSNSNAAITITAKLALQSSTRWLC